jgi:hypothetical protein
VSFPGGNASVDQAGKFVGLHTPYIPLKTTGIANEPRQTLTAIKKGGLDANDESEEGVIKPQMALASLSRASFFAKVKCKG